MAVPIMHVYSVLSSPLFSPRAQDIVESMGAMQFEQDLVARDGSAAKILELKDDVSAWSDVCVSLCVCVSVCVLV
jgi:hypothetical protein